MNRQSLTIFRLGPGRLDVSACQCPFAFSSYPLPFMAGHPWQSLSCHADTPDHSRLVMSSDQTGEHEVTGTIKRPYNLACLAGRYVGHVRLVMLHVRELHHEGRMLIERLLRADNHLVHHFPVVLQHESDRVALLHVHAIGHEAHRVEQPDLDRSFRILHVSCDTPRPLLLLDQGVFFSA